MGRKVEAALERRNCELLLMVNNRGVVAETGGGRTANVQPPAGLKNRTDPMLLCSVQKM